jgi:hypothetical protein
MPANMGGGGGGRLKTENGNAFWGNKHGAMIPVLKYTSTEGDSQR